MEIASQAAQVEINRTRPLRLIVTGIKTAFAATITEATVLDIDLAANIVVKMRYGAKAPVSIVEAIWQNPQAAFQRTTEVLTGASSPTPQETFAILWLTIPVLFFSDVAAYSSKRDQVQQIDNRYRKQALEVTNQALTPTQAPEA